MAKRVCSPPAIATRLSSQLTSVPATVAFPAISTGIFGYPVERAASVALRTTHDELVKWPQIERVTFVLFSDEHLHAFADAKSGLSRH